MKTLFKTSFLALAIALSVSACQSGKTGSSTTDSIDSASSASVDSIDSTASAKTDTIDSASQAKVDSLKK